MQQNVDSLSPFFIQIVALQKWFGDKSRVKKIIKDIDFGTLQGGNVIEGHYNQDLMVKC